MVLLGQPTFRSVFAQSTASVYLYNPLLNNFPSIGLIFEAYDEYGNFIHGITPAEIDIFEDGYVLPVNGLSLIEPGLETIVAFNEAAMLTYQYSNISYYEHIQSALFDGLSARPDVSNDVFSFITNTGYQGVRLTSVNQFKQSMLDYEPDLLNKLPGTASLAQALDLATDPSQNAYMKKAILYVTPLPTDEMISALPELTDRAEQLGVHVFVWLIAQASADAYYTEPLLQMAERTGGSFFVYTGGVVFPDINDSFNPYRYLYQLDYLSRIQQGGDHLISLQVTSDVFQASSQDLSFLIDVQPPKPIFLEPPTRVLRSLDTEDSQQFSPLEMPIQVLIEFPDGYQRGIAASRLFIDDELVLENLQPPFDQFDWNLEAYQQNGSVHLRVEVEDTLGLKQSTIETQVDILVEEPQLPWYRSIISGYGLVIVFSLLLAGGVLLLVLFWSSRRKRQEKAVERRNSVDPVTQPVLLRPDAETKKTKLSESLMETVALKRIQPKQRAALFRLSDDGQSSTNRAILINHSHFTLGSDNGLTNHVLDHPSVKPAHVLITRNRDNTFFLTELENEAGTLVNYAPVPATGIQLKNGDMIHIGKLVFRFSISDSEN